MKTLGFARAAAMMGAALGLASMPIIISPSAAVDARLDFKPSKSKGHGWDGKGSRRTASKAKTVRRNRRQAKRKAAARRMRSR